MTKFLSSFRHCTWLPGCRARKKLLSTAFLFLFAFGAGNLTARAKDFYAALFAGVDDFWQLVEVYGGRRHTLSADRVKAEFADRERDFTRIECCCGETYVDAVFPCDLPYTYLATRATADEFKRAIVERKAETANRGESHNGIKHRF